MDKALKQRLVGASVLIALAVVVLPMLLGGRPEGGTQETQKIEIPPQPPELSFETRRYPIGQQTPKNQGASQGDEPDETVTQLPAPRKPAVTPVPAAETAGTESGVPAGDEPVVADSVTAPVSASGAGESGAAGRYVVQVASFGALDNANSLSGVDRPRQVRRGNPAPCTGRAIRFRDGCQPGRAGAGVKNQRSQTSRGGPSAGTGSTGHNAG